VWFVAYHHLIRADEAGVTFVPDQAHAIAERLRLEALGFIVTRVAEVPPSGPAAIGL
jgi:hypothetical protein